MLADAPSFPHLTGERGGEGTGGLGASEIETERLLLVPMTVAAIDALIAGDRASLEAEVGAAFPEPLAPPPETGDVLVFFRSLVAEETEWVPRWIVLREPAVVVGSGGAMAPDVDGRCVIGYGIYPEHEGNGFATEAARGLVDALRGHVDVETVVATIHPYNLASRRVAEKVGLRVSGQTMDPEEGLLDVWELRVR